MNQNNLPGGNEIIEDNPLYGFAMEEYQQSAVVDQNVMYDDEEEENYDDPTMNAIIDENYEYEENEVDNENNH